MTTPQKEQDEQQATNSSELGLTGIIERKYRQIRENAETYPYVWGSYIVVYGGFGLWFAYRWMKLRRTEDRVRVLQERLRKLVEAEESTAASSSAAAAEAEKVTPPADDKTAK
ncbi:hypothetical protein U1Q18_009696 [Sarracenia purpurea var. burkii]